jgi:hypothetical protein
VQHYRVPLDELFGFRVRQPEHRGEDGGGERLREVGVELTFADPDQRVQELDADPPNGLGLGHDRLWGKERRENLSMRSMFGGIHLLPSARVGGYAGRGAREDLRSLQCRAEVLGLGQDPVPAVERTVEDPIRRRLAIDGERVKVQRGSMDVIEIPHQPGRDVIGDARVVGCHRCLLGENVMSLRTSPHHG